MKKQLFRVKQLADQTFSRATKTELLSDELAEADRHVEFLRIACTNTNKKLAACLLGMGADDAAREKRLRKCPEYLLGHAMLESASCEEQSLLREVLARCGGVQVALAQELVDLDVQVEQSVVNPLQAVLDTDVPSVLKHKRNLARLTLDMDSARTRYATSLKHNTTATGYQAKIDSIREEMEDAELKVDQCRDMLASEMFQLISREAELAKIISSYVHLQKSYHENALKFLENMTPELEAFISDSDMKPVFGFPLEEHLRVTGRCIALPIELCVCALLEIAMDEEGLFRVAGGASKVKRMRLSLDAGFLNLASAIECGDPHIVAGLLKSYLRELPEPLLTHLLYNDWIAAARSQGTEEVRLKALKDVVQRLPAANYDNLRYLVKFLAALAGNQGTNKMSPQNLAIVIAPNLIWDPDQEKAALGINMSTANIHSFIVDNLVTHSDFFFPENVDFYQTFHRESTDRIHNQVPTFPSKNDSVNGMSEEKGHARSSSGDTLLISYSSESCSDIKRTQSSSSLTETSSPPHSPKPVTRRKNKVAPHPPKVPNENDRPEKPPRPVTMHTTHVQSPTIPQAGPHRAMAVKPAEPTTPPPSQLKARCEPMENLTTIDKDEDQRNTSVIAHPSLGTDEMQSSSVVTPPSAVLPHVSAVPTILSTLIQPSVPPPPATIIAPAPESIRRLPVAAPRSFSSRELTPAMPELTAEVQERPKPAIPERPATLQRLSGSFRQSRHEENDIAGKLEQTRLEKPPPPVTEKNSELSSQPRASSMHEKRNSLEKPERPPKPDLPIAPAHFLPTVLPGGTDAPDLLDDDVLSDPVIKTSAIANTQHSQLFRPPRPQPPPPPPPGIKQRGGLAPIASESTDL